MKRLGIVSMILTIASLMIARHVYVPEIPHLTGPAAVAEVVLLVSL